jgi:hypothetical protein
MFKEEKKNWKDIYWKIVAELEDSNDWEKPIDVAYFATKSQAKQMLPMFHSSEYQHRLFKVVRCQ